MVSYRLFLAKLRLAPRQPVSPSWGNQHGGNLCVLLSLVVAMSSSLIFADVAGDQAAIDRLVQQGKFDHAELLCREQLQGDVPIERRAAFTVELLRVLTAKARQSTMVEADKILRSAEGVGEAYLRSDSQSTQRWLVEFQMALLPRLRGDLRCWQMGGVVGDSLHLRYLRDSRKQLELLAERMDVELRKSRGRQRRGHTSELSPTQLRELRALVTLELGKTYRAQAEAYPVGSDDRSLAAAEGERVLERIAPTAMTPDGWWRSRMEMLACLRLKSDWAASGKRFEVILADRIPPGGKAELRAEAVRIALARQNWSKVKSLVASGVPSMDLADRQVQAAADEMRLAYIEAYLALATRAQQTSDAVAARDYETRTAEAVDARMNASASWTRRVESLLARGASDADGSVGSMSGIPLTVRAARGLFRQGKLREASAAYQRAAEQAAATGDRRECLSFLMTAAAVLVQAKRPSEASRILRAVSVKQADLPAAPDAHLLAIKLVAPQGNGDVNDQERVSYMELLDEHLRWWPRGTTADQVGWWRGRAREHAGQPAAALEDYLRISPAFPEQAATIAAVERCANLVAEVPDVTKTESGLTVAVAGLLAVAGDDSAVDADRDAAALSAVRIALASHQKGGEVDRLDLAKPLEGLRSRLDQAEPATGARRLVLADGLYRMGRSDDAHRELKKATTASGVEWLELLQASQPLPQATEAQRAASSTWRLALIEHSRPLSASLSPSQRRSWERIQVEALVDSGTVKAMEKARTRIDDLIKQLPADAELRGWKARMLTTSGDAAAAVAAWRTVIAGSPPQSQRWYAAKFELAQLHWKQGDVQRAAEMVELLQALHPDLGGGEQKEKFLSLLKKCKK